MDHVVVATADTDRMAFWLAMVWVRVCTGVYEDLVAGRPRPPMRWYGATNPGEFFAVATEVFFEQARELQDREPALYDVLARFYRLPEPLIRRFYAGRSPMRDRVRLLTGRPPVPVLRALRVMSEARLLRARKAAS